MAGDWSRREVLKTAGVAATVSVGANALTQSATAARTEPDYIYYDEPLLETYKPYLITKDTEFDPTIYGFVADGDQANKDTTVCVYVCVYPWQTGVLGLDSHDQDHEWYYVHVRNVGTSDAYIERVQYSAYHWLKGESRDPAMATDTNPAAYVYEKHHHMSNQQAKQYLEQNQALAQECSLRDLRDAYPVWLDTDSSFDDALAEDVVYSPWLMSSRGDWWADSAGRRLDVWMLRNVFSVFGWYGGTEVDV